MNTFATMASVVGSRVRQGRPEVSVENPLCPEQTNGIDQSPSYKWSSSETYIKLILKGSLKRNGNVCNGDSKRYFLLLQSVCVW